MRQTPWIALAAATLALLVGYLLGLTAVPNRLPPTRDSVAAPAGDTGPNSTTARTRSHAPAASTRVAHISVQLPPPRTPLLSVFNELKARVDAGDTRAASRMFHDLESCRQVRFAQEVGLNFVAGALNEPTANKSSEELTQQDRWLERTQKMMDFVRDNTAMCVGVGPDQVDATVPAMLVAAQGGDLVALDCYLGLEISAVPGRLLDHPEWLTQYKNNAPGLAQSAIERGDWHVVNLLLFAYSAGSSGTELLGYAIGAHPNPEQAYRYQKLERLGASGQFAAQLDTMYPFVDKSLSKEQIAAADAWAQGTYSRYFNGTSSNELQKWESACPDVMFY